MIVFGCGWLSGLCRMPLRLVRRLRSSNSSFGTTVGPKGGVYLGSGYEFIFDGGGPGRG